MRNSINAENVAIICDYFIYLTGIAPEGDNFTLEGEKEKQG